MLETSLEKKTVPLSDAHLQNIISECVKEIEKGNEGKQKHANHPTFMNIDAKSF